MQILPSGQQPASGLALAPFRGLRYAQDRISGLTEVTSPPYDVIAQDAAAQLRAADPHNVVRLILPRHDAGNPGDAYTDAAQLFGQWQQQGILLPDPRPALYVYEQAMRGGEIIQRGLIGALRLTPLGAGTVLPHEDVMPGPVAGRRQLMEATGANLEPIFLLYDGDGEDGAVLQLAGQAAAAQPPLVTVDTDDGIRHRLWALADPAEHAAVAADLASRQALIADGHHRYAAYLQLQARKRASSGRDGHSPGPWDAGLALLVDSRAFPPRIGAIHRMIPGLSVPEAAERAKAAFTVRPLPGRLAGDASGMLDLLRESGGVAFVVAGGGEAHLLTDPDPVQAEAAMPGRSPRWRVLSASVLQELLLGRVWGIRDDESSVQVHHDAGRALRAAAQPPGGTAVICQPLTAADVRAVAAHGERVPRKSTSFAPKPRTGLVLRSFAYG
ncbi:MAG TPA: DUF1015 domain-containing protein [Streptosporangiaceae bacterium]|nr:DUF1015 domain-containing protein [Streptosporangiaceae bacterium]